MERITDIFEPTNETDPVSDLDVDIAHAGHVLSKLAEEEGIDLDSMTDNDVAELVSDLLPESKTSADKTTEEPEPTRKEATMADEKTTITHADVAVELAKIAAASNIDLSTVGRDEYHEAYDKLAARMSDPNYETEKKAEEEKYAASYAQGVAMAEGFIDRLKAAEEEDGKKEEKHEKEDKKDEKHEEKEASAAAFMSHLKDTAKKHLGHAGAKAHEVAGAAKHKATEGGKKLIEHAKGHKHEYAAGAAGAGAGAAAGAAGMAHHKKHSLDDAALAVAESVLRENGFDPATGQKIAADAPDFSEDDVAKRAAEMLKEAGYEVPV